MSLSNQICNIQPILTNSHYNEYNEEFPYHLFAVKLDKCVRNCNTLNGFSNKACFPNKTQVLNIHVLNKITEKTNQEV